MPTPILGFLTSLIFLTSASITLAASPSSVDEDICAAAEAGKTAEVADLLTKGAKADAQCADHETPLMLAAGEGHLDTVQLLVSKGAKVNEEGGGSRALEEAAAEGHNDVVQFLLDHHADLSLAGGRLSPLQEAARHGQSETVKLLLAHGAKVDEGLDAGWSALLYAAQGGDLGMLQVLVAGGANVNAKGAFGQTALILAAAAPGRTDETIRFLLDKGAEPNARTREGYTALMNAAHMGQAATVKLLLERGADPNARNNADKTALMLASNSATRELLSNAAMSGGQRTAGAPQPASAPNATEANPSPPASPSLGDLARQQRAQRESQAPPKVVYTNEGRVITPSANPPSAPASTAQSTAGEQGTAGVSAKVPTTATLTVNGKQTNLTHVIAVPDENMKGWVMVYLSDVPLTEGEAHRPDKLALKSENGELHAAEISFNESGQPIGLFVYDIAFPNGISPGGRVNFQQKIFDGTTVAGTVTGPNNTSGPNSWQLAGPFTAKILRPPPAPTQAESLRLADKPAAKVALSYVSALRAKNVAQMKTYMTAESARKLDAMSPELRNTILELAAAGLEKGSLRVSKYTEKGNTAEVEVVGETGQAITVNLVLEGSSWKIRLD